MPFNSKFRHETTRRHLHDDDEDDDDDDYVCDADDSCSDSGNEEAVAITVAMLIKPHNPKP